MHGANQAHPGTAAGAAAARTLCRVVGTGSALPARILTNREIEAMVETTDEWIVTRTGIRERRIAEFTERTSDYAARAARAALAAAHMGTGDVGLIVVGTTSPDLRIPATANFVQQDLGAARAFVYDVNAACSGFLFALAAAEAQIRAGQAESGLVIGADLYSSLVNWKDRDTCVLFGDGAGAVALRKVEGSAGSDPDAERGILAMVLRSTPVGIDILGCKGAGTADRTSLEAVPTGFIHMEGRKVFRLAIDGLEGAVRAVLEKVGRTVKDLDWVVPHQANRRIIEEVVSRLGYGMDRVVINLDRYGNTSAASIPIALDEAVRDGRIKPGHLVLLAAAGAGFSAGAVLIRM